MDKETERHTDGQEDRETDIKTKRQIRGSTHIFDSESVRDGKTNLGCRQRMDEQINSTQNL